MYKAIIATINYFENDLRQTEVEVKSTSWKKAYIKMLRMRKPCGWKDAIEWVSGMADNPDSIRAEMANGERGVHIHFIKMDQDDA